MAGRTMSFSHDDAVATALAMRSEEGVVSRSEALHRVVARYIRILDRHLPTLSDDEWMVLRAALNGVYHEPIELGAATLPDQIDDALIYPGDAREIAEANGINRETFVARLRALDFAARVAVLDAVERWWIANG